MVSALTGADDAGLKQIELSATVHLAFNELSLVIFPSIWPLGEGNVIA